MLGSLEDGEISVVAEMTVRELIENLSTHDPDLKVFVGGEPNDPEPRIGFLRTHRNKPNWHNTWFTDAADEGCQDVERVVRL